MDVPRGTIFEKELRRTFEGNGMTLTAGQMEQMGIYYSLLFSENEKYNLTSITNPEEAAEKHFLDSVAPFAEIPQNAKVIDVGSGAGFPMIPLAILRKDIRAFILEASAKKCAFIEKACRAAGIGVKIINGRAEELAHTEFRESFDICVSRAVAGLNVLAELCIPYVVPEGAFFAYKGKYVDELKQGEAALAELGASLEKVVMLENSKRSCNVLIFRKTGSSQEKYPRKYKQIIKRPL